MLERDFFRQDARLVAQSLLGKLLVRETPKGWIQGIITETEAYLGTTDRASKAFKGIKTKGNAPMFMDGGYAYVYLTYGIHYLMNITTGIINDPQAVLIRSVDLVDGINLAIINRYGKMDITDKQKENLSNGPGKLTKALQISKEENGLDITKPPLYVMEGEKPQKILVSKRIGIDYAKEAKDYLWRYEFGRDDRI